jgi:hypothetical protein
MIEINNRNFVLPKILSRICVTINGGWDGNQDAPSDYP